MEPITVRPCPLCPPGLRFITPASRIQYFLYTYKNNRLALIPVPSPHFSWISGAPSIVSVDASGSILGKTVGRTGELFFWYLLHDQRAELIRRLRSTW